MHRTSNAPVYLRDAVPLQNVGNIGCFVSYRRDRSRRGLARVGVAVDLQRSAQLMGEPSKRTDDGVFVGHGHGLGSVQLMWGVARVGREVGWPVQPPVGRWHLTKVCPVRTVRSVEGADCN